MLLDTVLPFISCSLKAYSGGFGFDVLVVDDSSSDGTSSHVKKRGYAVITNRSPKGVTYSWNLGYKIAKTLGYDNMIFANNDLLVSHGSVEALVRGLREHPLAVPVTSFVGAGHNPAQAISVAHKLVDISVEEMLRAIRTPTTSKEREWLALEEYCMFPSNAGFIQDYLYSQFKEAEVCHDSNSSARVCPPLVVPAVFRKVSRFNGFFFAVNLTSIAPAAYSEDELFDPTDVMVEQENKLVVKMDMLNMVPVISLHSFIFHFKSVTVAVANFTRDKNETRNDLSFYHPQKSANIAHEVFRHMPPGLVER